MKQKIHKITKILGITLVAIAILLYLTPFFLKETITKSVNEIAKDYIKSDVHFNEINLSFYKHFPNLTVELNHSEIGASDFFPNQKFVEAQEISLGIDLFSLFGDKISFNQLYLSKAEINIKTDSLGNSNFDVFISDNQTQKEDTSVNLNFKKIKIKNTQLTYEDAKTKTFFLAKDLSFDGSVAFIDNVIDLKAKTIIKSVTIALDKIVYIDDKTLEGNVNTQINLTNLGLKFTNSSFVLEKFPFLIDGSIDLPKNAIDFNFKVTSINNQLVDLLSIIPKNFQNWYEKTEIEGQSSFEFELKGIMNDSLKLSPDANLSLKISNGLINYNKSNHPITNIKLDAKLQLPELNPDSIVAQISNFNFKLSNGFAKGELTYKAPTTIQANLKTKVDLTMLKQASGLSYFDMKGFLDIDAKIDGTFKKTIKKVGLRNKEQVYIASVPKIDLVSKLTDGYFKMKDMPVAVEEIFADVVIKNTDGFFENTTILLNQLKAKASDNYIDGFAKVYNLKNYQMETNLKAKINLADLSSIYPIKSVELRGNLTANFNANGTYEPLKNKFPISKSNLKLTEGFLKYTDIPELPIEDIKVEMNVYSSKGSMRDLRIEVLPISFKLAGEPFKLDADLYNFNNLTYKINSNGTLDLSKIYKIFAIEGYNVNGWIRANLNINGNGSASDKSSVNNRGFLDLKDIYLDSELFPNSFIVKNGKLKFLKEKIILDNIQAKYASSSFKITGNISNYMNFALQQNAILNGNVNIETQKINIDEFMAFNSNSVSSVKNSTNSGVVLVPSNFNINLNANAQKVLFNGVQLSNFKGVLKVDNGSIALNDTQFNLIGSIFDMNGSYKPLTPKMAKFNYSIRANDFSIQKAYNEITLFRELASAAKDVYGSVSLNYELSGVLDAEMSPKLKTIVGNGVLTLNDIQFKGFKLFNAVSEKTSVNALHDAKASKVEIKTSIANNVMTIEPTKFKIAGFRPKIQGKITLDGKMNLGFRLGLPPFGIIGIPMTITGNSDDFKIKMGKQKEEELEETDEDYQEYLKAIQSKDSINNL